MGVIGSITLTNIDDADLYELSEKYRSLQDTINNSFWSASDNNDSYMYYGNNKEYNNGKTALRMSNNSLSICLNNTDSHLDGKDRELARFNDYSLMLHDSYELRYDGNKGLYFKPLI